MFALLARIQHLLPGHKYALLGAMASVLWLEQMNETAGVRFGDESCCLLLALEILLIGTVYFN